MARDRKKTTSDAKAKPTPTFLESLADPAKRAAARAAAIEEFQRQATEQLLSVIRDADAIFETDPRRAMVIAVDACGRFVSDATMFERTLSLNAPQAGRTIRALTAALHDLDSGIVHAALAPVGKAGDAKARITIFEVRMRVWASVAVEFRRRRLRGRWPLRQACKEVARELPMPRHKGYSAGEPWKVLQQWRKEVREGRGPWGAACKRLYESRIEGLDRKRHSDNNLDFDDLALTYEAMALTRAKEAAREWQVASNAEVTINNDARADLLGLIDDVFARGGGE